MNRFDEGMLGSLALGSLAQYAGVFAVWAAAFLAAACHGQTGTFIDRQFSSDLRVMTYNIYLDSIFPEISATEADKFARVVNALGPDILNLQEIYDHSSSQVRSLMNSIAPLADGASWYVHQAFDNVIVSKYPLTMLRTGTIPSGDLSLAIGLVNLPDDQFPADFYLMNNHYKCCGTPTSEEEERRKRQSDANVNWLRDARTPGGNINLPPGTPFAVVGDLNTINGSFQPLNTLITGNIVNEGTYGSDSPPDWDGSNLTDPNPYHNGGSADNYTYRSGSTRSRLDYIIYSDSALDVGTKFVLNAYSMTAAQRTATGLLQFDTAQGNSSTNFDHLPVVVDFRIFAFAESDFNYSRTVDQTDLAIWQAGYGTTSGAARTAGDADGDGDVDGRDFLAWQRQYDGGAPAFAAVPEPTSLGLLLLAFATIAVRSKRR